MVFSVFRRYKPNRVLLKRGVSIFCKSSSFFIFSYTTFKSTFKWLHVSLCCHGQGSWHRCHPHSVAGAVERRAGWTAGRGSLGCYVRPLVHQEKKHVNAGFILCSIVILLWSAYGRSAKHGCGKINLCWAALMFTIKCSNGFVFILVKLLGLHSEISWIKIALKHMFFSVFLKAYKGSLM